MDTTVTALRELHAKASTKYLFAKQRFRELVAAQDMERALKYFEAAVRLERLVDFLEEQIEEEKGGADG